MNPFKDLHAVVVTALEDMARDGALPAGLDFERVGVEPPRDPSHGDVATNAVMVLAKPAAMKPRDLAEKLAERLRLAPHVTKVEVAGPGFLNLTLEPSYWHGCLAGILRSGADYGRSNLGGDQLVNVEYVSTNPTGPLTVGHARGAVVGDALANLLEAVGYKVKREYYINDAGQGGQLVALARSVYYRYREALGAKPNQVPDGFYPGNYLIPVGNDLAKQDGDKWLNAEEAPGTTVTEQEKGWRERCATFGVDEMMALIKRDLAALGVHHDVFTSERDLHKRGAVERVEALLRERGLLYTGTLEPPKGKVLEDWEPRPQLLFRSTRSGDDVDRPLRRADGSSTYFEADIAYHLDKYQRGFNLMIDVWGADHGGYVKRMKAAVEALTEGQGRLEILICQLVKLMRADEPVKMSKRSGNFVTLREVIDEVGKDVVRFIMLTRKNDAPLDFDLVKVTEQSRDNPVFYVQYAHARARSVLRLAAAELPDLKLDPAALADSPALARLTDSDELGLIKQLALWPRLLEGAAEAYEPHRVAYYLYDVAAAFHGLWTKGKDEARLRFLVADDAEVTAARLALVQGCALVIASGLAIFGVEPAEEMR
jgi:arginyl-tRNA synthetase